MSGSVAEAVRLTCRAAEEHATETDTAGAFPVATLDVMRRTGLLGLLVPARYGGGAGTLTDLVEVTTALGRADLSVALIFAMHCQQVAVVARYGAQKLCEHVLPGIADGKIYLGSVTTAPGTGGHLLTSSAEARQAGDCLLVDREAPIVTGGKHADAFLITMRTPDAISPAQIDLVYASRDQLHVEVTGDWQPLGMRASESVPMRLAGRIPDWQVIGDRGDFRSIAAAAFAPLAHIGWSAAWLGTAMSAYSRVLRHLRSGSGREQFAPGSELLLSRLAATRARLDVVHALLQHSVRVLTECADPMDGPVQLLINTLKIEASEGCFTAVNEMMDLVGLRHGYLTGSPLRLERAFRDLRSASLNYPNDRLRLANGALALMDTGVRLA